MSERNAQQRDGASLWIQRWEGITGWCWIDYQSFEPRKVPPSCTGILQTAWELTKTPSGLGGSKDDFPMCFSRTSATLRNTQTLTFFVSFPTCHREQGERIKLALDPLIWISPNSVSSSGKAPKPWRMHTYGKTGEMQIVFRCTTLPQRLLAASLEHRINPNFGALHYRPLSWHGPLFDCWRVP